jgi:hypothetical protein
MSRSPIPRPQQETILRALMLADAAHHQERERANACCGHGTILSADEFAQHDEQPSPSPFAEPYTIGRGR